METTVKKLTPENAKIILQGHKNYRALSRDRVDAYASVMAAGSWGISTIIFNEHGDLIDGQTRLRAMIKSNTAHSFVVISGWPSDQSVNIDSGQGRSRSQVAIAERGIKNATKIMGIVAGIAGIMGEERAVLNCQAIDFYDRYGELAEELFSCASPCGPLRCAVHLIPFARAILALPNKKAEIIEALEKTAALNFAEPRMSGLRLYYRLVIEQRFTRGGGGARKSSYLRCSRAIVAYLDGQKIDKLFECAEDPFPLKK